MRHLFKKPDYTYQNSAVPLDVSILNPNKRKAKCEHKKKADINFLGSRDQKFLPACLLREPLTPEQQQTLDEDEKRIYKNHKAKFSAMNKRKQKQSDTPPPPTLNEARRMRAGTFHHNDDDDDEGCSKLTDKKEAVTKYILRDDDFKENLNLHDFEKAAREICKAVDYKF